MSVRVVITEKPSVAATIAKVIGANSKKRDYFEGNGYLVSWNYGHLFELKQADAYDPKFKKWTVEDLPIIPERFEYQIKNDSSIKKHFSALREILNSANTSEIINAGDAGREGELIFRLTYYQAHCKKPVKRLWLSSMEEKAIRQEFNNLKDGKEYDPLFFSAKARQEADWLIGINGTRLFTVLHRSKDKKSNVKKVGRVQSPTLSMIVNREKEIKNFKPEFYKKVVAILDYNDCHFYAYTGRIDDVNLANNLVNLLTGGTPLVVSNVKKEEHKAGTPHLYDLTSLQKDASKFFGLTADETLTSMQRLYERKLATYPRTDSQYLADDMGNTALEVLKAVEQVFPFHNGVKTSNPNIKPHLNTKKVTDHHAIIPTVEILKGLPSDLDDNDKKVLWLVAERVIEAFGETHIYESTEIDFKLNEVDFVSKGKIIVHDGWKEKQSEFKAFVKADPEEARDKNADNEDQALPSLSKGSSLKATKAVVKSCQTTAPKRFTESTILSAMENAGASETSKEAERKGLGTPATRAEILKKLVSDGYVVREKKNLVPTPAGIELIKILPEEFKSPLLTANWENKLVLIAKRQGSYNDFINGIKNEVVNLVNSYQGGQA